VTIIGLLAEPGRGGKRTRAHAEPLEQLAHARWRDQPSNGCFDLARALGIGPHQALGTLTNAEPAEKHGLGDGAIGRKPRALGGA
jgi:hypothetical protein